MATCRLMDCGISFQASQVSSDHIHAPHRSSAVVDLARGSLSSDGGDVPICGEYADKPCADINGIHCWIYAFGHTGSSEPTAGTMSSTENAAEFSSKYPSMVVAVAGK